MHPSALIDIDRLVTCLGNAASRMDVMAIAECGSTNTLLMDAVPQHTVSEDFDPRRNILLLADRQTAGRGRRGRRWFASPEDSLTFSLRWNFPRGTDLSGLSLAVGLALWNGLQMQGAQGVVLKWPNDLLVNINGRFSKLGGILIELSSRAGCSSAVIGVGINLRTPQNSEIDQPITGLDSSCVNSPPLDRHELVAGLLIELVRTMDRFSMDGFAPFQSAWNEADGFSGRNVVLSNEGREIHRGTCLGVDENGVLRVATAQGEIRWLAGDVSLRLQDGLLT